MTAQEIKTRVKAEMNRRLHTIHAGKTPLPVNVQDELRVKTECILQNIDLCNSETSIKAFIKNNAGDIIRCACKHSGYENFRDSINEFKQI